MPIRKNRKNRRSNSGTSVNLSKQQRNPQHKRVFLGGLRSILFSRFMLVVLGILLLAGGLGYYLFFTDQFVIKNVEIEGATSNLREDVEGYFSGLSQEKRFLVLKQNKTVFFPEGKFYAGIKRAVPKVKNVSLNVSVPHSVNISIESRTQEGIFCNASKSTIDPSCYFYGDEGVIYQEAPSSRKGTILKTVWDMRDRDIKLGDKVITKDTQKFVDTLFKALDKGYKKPQLVRIVNDSEVHAEFNEGFSAYFSRDDDVVTQVENFILVLDEEIGRPLSELSYIDLRAGDKVFYKYESE